MELVEEAAVDEKVEADVLAAAGNAADDDDDDDVEAGRTGIVAAAMAVGEALETPRAGTACATAGAWWWRTY